jgi:hypothetical protein
MIKKSSFVRGFTHYDSDNKYEIEIMIIWPFWKRKDFD